MLIHGAENSMPQSVACNRRTIRRPSSCWASYKALMRFTAGYRALHHDIAPSVYIKTNQITTKEQQKLQRKHPKTQNYASGA